MYKNKAAIRIVGKKRPTIGTKIEGKKQEVVIGIIITILMLII
jgi:hypothetical protein